MTTMETGSTESKQTTGAAGKGATNSRKGPRTKDSAAKGVARQGAAKKRTPTPVSASAAPDGLRKDLRAFAATRPQGWNHEEWTGLLAQLRERGHDISDPDAIGSMLERERLSALLEGVPGLGPKRVQAITERFDALWRLRNASADEISREANLPLPLAEKIAEVVR